MAICAFLWLISFTNGAMMAIKSSPPVITQEDGEIIKERCGDKCYDPVFGYNFYTGTVSG